MILPKSTQRKWAIGLGIVVGLLLVVFLSRGFVRERFWPGVTERYRTSHLDATYRAEYSKLRDPLVRLGLPAVNLERSRCYPERSRLWATNVHCINRTPESGGALTPAQLAQFSEHAKAVEATLRTNGWVGHYPKETLVDVNPSNWPHQRPDGSNMSTIVYAKDMGGGVYCQLEIYAGQHNHLRSSYWCNQTFKYLGDPYSLE